MLGCSPNSEENQFSHDRNPILTVTKLRQSINNVNRNLNFTALPSTLRGGCTTMTK